MSRSVVRAITSGALALLLLTSISKAKLYRVIDLGSLYGGITTPEAINNKGEVVGTSEDPSSQDNIAFYWANGTMTNLGTLGGGWSAAWDINDAGVIVGDSPDGTNTPGQGGFTATIGGGLIPVDGFSVVTSINNRGDIAGTSSNGNPAVMIGGAVSVIPVTGAANAINDSGWAVGDMYVADGNPPQSVLHGFEFKDGTLTDLGNLQGLYNAGAHDINDSGLIVGSGHLLLGYSVFEHACEWRSDSIIDIYLPTGPQNSYCFKLNKHGDIVGGGYNNIGGYSYFPYYHFSDGGVSMSLVDDPGWRLTILSDINDSGQIVGTASLNGVEHGVLLNPVHLTFQIVDALGNPAKNDSVSVYREFNDAPYFNNMPLGKYKTDSTGLLRMPDDSLDIGYHFRVSLDVKNVPAAKHVADLGTKYSVILDNAVFDTVGAMSYDTVSGDSAQLVILGHTTMAYDLLVSIEWDADQTYLNSLQQGYQRFSDYLYDVSDGQIRLDTVQIYTNGDHWNDADFRIYASNMQWPQANPSGIDSTDRYLYFPRVFFGNNDVDRNNGFYQYPFNLNDPYDYRTKVHEFGHYALGFYDEYLFADSTGTLQNKVGRCTDPRDGDYGCMDYQYPDNPSPYTSEWSSSFAYMTFTCRNNAEWIMRGMSCWDYLQSWAQYTDATKGVLVQILRPDDRIREAGLDYIPGPNDDLINSKWTNRVGLLVQFPINNPAALATTLTAYLTDSVSGVGVGKSSVKLRHADGSFLDEGQTSDAGGIRLLGYLTSDSIVASGRIKIPAKSANVANSETWVSGKLSPGSASTVFWNLGEVTGSFPAVCSAGGDSAATTYVLTSPASFMSAPAIEWDPDTGPSQTDTLQPVPGGYSGSITGDLGSSGSFTVQAMDSAYNPFFFSTQYTVGRLDTSFADRRIFGPSGQCEVRIDTANTQARRVLIVGSDYLPVRSGLDPAAIEGGEAFSVAIDSLTSLSGTNQITIRYSETSLYSDSGNPIESYLQLYRWNPGSAQWDLIGGTVDTADNEISGPMTQTGVYAAFTNNSPTDINDHGTGSLPQDFELGQNYPNPFNPSTTIDYTLPTRSHVTLTVYNLLGRRVKTIVDGVEAAGYHAVVWDGRDVAGNSVASGVYFYKLATDNSTASRKMLLLK